MTGCPKLGHTTLVYVFQIHFISEQSYSEDEVRDIQFASKIARNDSGIKVQGGHKRSNSFGVKIYT